MIAGSSSLSLTHATVPRGRISSLSKVLFVWVRSSLLSSTFSLLSSVNIPGRVSSDVANLYRVDFVLSPSIGTCQCACVTWPQGSDWGQEGIKRTPYRLFPALTSGTECLQSCRGNVPQISILVLPPVHRMPKDSYRWIEKTDWWFSKALTIMPKKYQTLTLISLNNKQGKNSPESVSEREAL